MEKGGESAGGANRRYLAHVVAETSYWWASGLCLITPWLGSFIKVSACCGGAGSMNNQKELVYRGDTERDRDTVQGWSLDQLRQI